MGMVGFNSFKDEEISFDTYSVSVKKQEKTDSETLSDGNERSDVDCFKELCEKFPYASFYVEDRSLEWTDHEWLPERFLGSSNLQNFSNLDTLSIAFDKRIFEKAANEPEFMEILTKVVENLNNGLTYRKQQCLHDGMKYAYVEMFFKEDGAIGYVVGEHPDPFHLFDLYFERENNPSELQSDNTVKRILEEYEKQKQEGLFAMMDKIQENSDKLKKQIDKDMHMERIKKEYEKTFLFENEKSMEEAL